MTTFSEKDIEQLISKGISREKVLNQINTFEEGIPFIHLERPAKIDDGILRFSKSEQNALIKNYEKSKKGIKILKFVPASGAASRMFKSLFEFLESFDPEEEKLAEYLSRTGNSAMEKFFSNLEAFPFYDAISKKLDKKASKDQQALQFVQEMLWSDKMHFDFYPKGLLPFHNYERGIETAFEEHLKEGARYASSDGKARLHFTVSEQHETMFLKTYDEIKEKLSGNTGIDYIVNLSQQKASTDTIAVTEENEPFREADGSILFRPGGHGALIENLNDQDADIIFIKNIDNVVVDTYADDTDRSKKVLAGLLVKLQAKAFELSELLYKDDLDVEQMQQVQDFLSAELNVRFPINYNAFSLSEQIEILRDKINRPIRVCGMVKNEGEPGGGPFWIRDANGHESLQIVESAQVDMSEPKQADAFKDSSHFNPVDLVCGVRNFRSEKYNLLNFVDVKQGFISEKTKDGKALKALELPGLWNGAMAYWNTVFVEVPLITFNPVKTVNDLLKPEHQPK